MFSYSMWIDVNDLFTTVKNTQFRNFLKMPNNNPLTIENFDFEKLRAKTFESKKSGNFYLLCDSL